MNGPSPLYARDAPAVSAPALRGEARTGTVIVGAGFTGLSAALHLAEAGRAVIVLDAHAPGWGASGRNGGQVNPGLKPDPDEVARDIGGARGERLVQAAWDAPDLVFALIERHGIACDAARGGTLRAATRPEDCAALRSLAAQCDARGMDTALLDADATAARTGTPRYLGALLDRRGGQVNPLAYARGLALAAQRLGATLHAGSAARAIRRAGGGWQVDTDGGSVQADRVVIATNGYTDGLWPKLRRSIVPVYSAIIASTVLPEARRRTILAGREVVYELGEVTTYSRVDASGRLLVGGRSQSRHLAGPACFGFLARHAAGLWPDLAGIGWEHGWNGQLAMTTDHYPHWHEPAPGVLACLGYNGRGVAMATLLGRELARRAQGLAADALLLPASPIRPIPLHPAWPVGVAARLLYGRARAAKARMAAGAGRGS